MLPPAAASAQGRTEVAAIPAVDRTAWDAANARLRAAVEAGQTASLIPLATEALRIAERTFGPTARETLVSVRWLADLNYQQGRRAAAAPLYKRALKELGRQEPFSIVDGIAELNSNYNLAIKFQTDGRYAAAAPLFEQAVRSNAHWMGAHHPDTLRLTSAMVANLLADPVLALKARDPARNLAVTMRASRDAAGSPGLSNEVATDQLGNSSVALFERCDLAKLHAARDPANNLDAFVLLADADWVAARQRSESRAAMAAETFVALQDAVVGTAALAVERTAVRLAAERKAPGLGALVRERQNLDDRATRHAYADAEHCGATGDTAFERSVELAAEGQRIEIGVERVEARLRAEFPEYFTAIDTGALDLAATQRLLESDEAILLVVPTAYGTQVMAVSRTQLEWRRSVWNRGRIALSVKRLLFDMGQEFGVDAATRARWIKEGGPGTPFDRKTAYALYRQIVAPVAGALAGKRHVFIAASGALTSLPFGVLVTEPPRGGDGDPKALRSTKWFADTRALSVIPSIRALQLLRDAPPGVSQAAITFAGYGDPALTGRALNRGLKSAKAIPARSVFQTAPTRGGGVANVALLKSMASLPGTEVELENMRAAMGAPASSVHLQGRATERAVRSDDLSHVRILAFATHGLMAGELTGASEPGLVFTPPAQASDADDGYLTASEVTELKLDADWVILSACNTAAGDGSEGAPGLSGLARAFFYAGARNLLVSHWPVRDDVAARLTVDAIRRRQANPGLGRAEALQQAMAAIRNDATHDTATDTWAHPEAWAPFSLIGDGAN